MILSTIGFTRDFNSKLLFTLLLMASGTSVFSQSQASPPSVCGTLYSPGQHGQYGPYDYRTDTDKLPIVLAFHFTPEVEALIKGHSDARIGTDIDYTLRAIPNYHRALIAMMRLGEKEKTPQPNGSRYTIDCWFQRATLFRPDDSIVRMIYSTYLNKQGRMQDANAQLAAATNYAKDSGFTHYNIGLHYFELKNYSQALVQAHKAMELGFPQTTLRDKLQSIEKWTEPVVLPATAPADATSAPPATKE